MTSVYWSHSYRDLRTKLKLKVGHEQSLISQEYQTLSILLSQLFGSSKSQAKPPDTWEQAEAQFKKLFGG